MSDNSTNDSNDDVLGLIWITALAYGAYKLFSSSSSDTTSRKSLSPSMVKAVVDEIFRNISEEDAYSLVIYCIMPDFLGLNPVKKEICDKLLYDRIHHINQALQAYKNNYSGYYPTFGDGDIYDLMSYMKEDCLNAIKGLTIFEDIKGSFIGKFSGGGLIKSVISARKGFNILQAMNKGLVEFFTYYFVYGADKKRSKEALLRAYVDQFI